jgi:O-antigen ligase
MGCLLLGLLAIIVAASRGGLVGSAATLLFILFRSRRRARNLIVAGLALALLLVVLPSSPLHRALHPAASDTRSTQLHLLVWQAGLRMVRAHPIGGVGLGNFKAVVASYADPSLNIGLIAHDTYIEMAAELGLPGLLAYLAILFFTFRSLGQTRREARKAGQILIFQAASGLQAGLVGFCVTQLFVSAEFLKLFWFAVFISACLPWLLARAKGLQKSSAKEAAFLSQPAGQLA